MEFTGERFIPNGVNDPELEIEHMQRYYAIALAVRGKTVLDAACGEGYGSDILAQNALQVYGIDISAEAIEHAQSQYVGRNLTFIQASVDSIPIGDHSIDIVVSFETIEHLDEITQVKFLKEMKRVLKDGGFLVISTPNKLIYSDLPGYQNKHHSREFYEEDFRILLEEHFKHVDFYDQQFEVVSLIDHPQVKTELIKTEIYNGEELDKRIPGKYIIAVCSNLAIKPLFSLGSLVFNPGRYQWLIERIQELQDHIEERNEHMRKLDDLIETNNAIIIAQNNRIEELSAWGRALDQEVKEKSGLVEIQNLQIWELIKWGNSLGEERKKPISKREKDNTNSNLFKVIAKDPAIFLKHINYLNFFKLLRSLRNENLKDLGARIESYLRRYTPAADGILELFEQTNSFEILKFNDPAEPVVSIIIPVHNQWVMTYSCLKSVLANTGNLAYEVILADDASTDETSKVSDYVQNVRVLRSEENTGFLHNCNRAGKEARGKYILFLNNDTNVQKGWLKSLLDLSERDQTIGLVGSKLVYPDGKLQEAGGIIWRDASGWNYGRHDNPGKPEYNYVKEVDYISGASIMIRSELWQEIGGFDNRFAPAYFEDADLAFEVRKRGYKVVLQPKSVVVHFEGVSHGKDTGVGIKSYQVINKVKFLQKWHDVLESEHSPSGENVFSARDKSMGKKTILIIDHYVPHYDKDAGSRTTFQYLKLFAEMDFNVKFMGDNFFKHEPYTSELQQLGIEVLYGEWYKDHYRDWIKENAAILDYIYLNRPHVAIKYIDFLRKYTEAKIIYYGHDLHYLREHREYELTGNPKVLKSSDHWKKIEFELVQKADAVYYPSQVEVKEVKKHFPNINAKVIPAYIFDSFGDKKNLPPERRKDLLFVGGFGHKPNVDAVLWFVKEIFPKVLREVPNVKFYIVGSNPPESIRRLHSNNVVVTGFVSEQELQEYYQNCRMAVIPLRYGAGIKGKLVEAMYHQIPVITTSIGAEGLKEVANHLLICDQEDVFAENIVQVYDNYEVLSLMVQSSGQYVKRYFSKENVLTAINEDIFAFK
ncbi:MAG: glycosyltransferase [Desulfitobacteriaceae bacterium]